MKRSVHRVGFGLALLLLGIVLVVAFVSLEDAEASKGPLAAAIDGVAPPVSGAQNVVAAVLFDFRPLDSMLEELMLLAAVLGATALLRPSRDEDADGGGGDEWGSFAEPASALLRAACGAGVVALVILSVHIAVHGHITPGGGFTAGVIASAAAGLVYLVGNHPILQRMAPAQAIQVVEGAAILAVILGGLVPLAFDAAMFENLLPPGTPGEAWSAGQVPLFNIAVGIAVGSGITLLVTEFVRQTDIIREGRVW